MLKDLLKRMEEMELAAKNADPNTEEGKEIIERAALYGDRAKEAFGKNSWGKACYFLIDEFIACYEDIDQESKNVKFPEGREAQMREIGVLVSELMKNPKAFKGLDKKLAQRQKELERELKEIKEATQSSQKTA